MPGKVNPVMFEMMDMVCFQVIGCDTTVLMAAQAGQLELNVMMPVVAFNLLHEIEILTNAIRVFDRLGPPESPPIESDARCMRKRA